MLERVTVIGDPAYSTVAVMLDVRIAPERVALFRRWARHLGLSESDLALLIFQLGTVELALETCNGSPAEMAEREVGTVADYMLDRLERLSQTWAEQKEGEDSGTHLAR